MIEISNPGGLPSGLSKEMFGRKSVTRNHVIAELLHRAGYIEKIGTGIKRIKDAVAESKTCQVEFEISEQWFTTIFYRGKSDISSDISSDITQENILNLLRKDSSLSASKLSEILNLSTRAIEKQLAQLKQQQLITRTGSKRYGKWIVKAEKANEQK